jgi:hypothetical protein
VEDLGTPAPVGEPLNPAFLIAIEDFAGGFAGDPELPAQFRHWLARLASEPQIEVFRPSPNTPSTAFSLHPKKGEKVYLISIDHRNT